MNIQYIISPQAYVTAPINVELKQEAPISRPIFHCGYCNEVFINKKDLKNHKETKHLQIIKGEQKNRKFKNETQSTSLIGNQFVHHQSKFTCEYCFKGFDQNHRLKQHQVNFTSFFG